jgi:hypothetical protein
MRKSLAPLLIASAMIFSGCTKCRVTEIAGEKSLLWMTGDMNESCDVVIIDGKLLEKFNKWSENTELSLAPGAHVIEFKLHSGKVYKREFENAKACKIELWL